MTRLIDGDALTDNVDRYIYRITRASTRKLKVGESAILADIKAHIELSPTVDAEPVRHGKWIETEENHGFDNEVRNKALACSVCQVAFRISDYEQIEGFRYCPNCGCRMDEE